MGFALVSFAHAQTEPKVQGPIEELGGCSSKEACKVYCDEPSHVQACVSYAVKAGFMTEEQAQKSLKFANQTGPGGCMGSACKAYCSVQGHYEECQAFAEKNGLTGPRGKTPKERGEAPKIDETKAEALIAEKGGPGGCTNMNECRAYCEDGSHMDACMAYAKENSLMSQEEIDRAQKFMTKEGPGGCKGIACREYCEDPSHHEECYAFAKQNGFAEEHPEGGPQEGSQQGPMEGRFVPPPADMRCSTPDECRALYETYRNEPGSSEMPVNSGTNMPRGEYQYSEPSERPQGAPMSPEEYNKRHEQYRTEYQLTPEQKKMYEQYRQGEYKLPEGGTAPYPPPSDGGSTPPPPPPSSFSPVSFTASAFSAILNLFGF